MGGEVQVHDREWSGEPRYHPNRQGEEALGGSVKDHGGNLVIFCKDDDWIIDRRDEVADAIMKLVRQAKRKTKMYQHKGTYRMRAWLMPEGESKVGSKGPFQRPGR